MSNVPNKLLKLIGLSILNEQTSVVCKTYLCDGHYNLISTLLRFVLMEHGLRIPYKYSI
jgi:hypothetical protein